MHVIAATGYSIDYNGVQGQEKGQKEYFCLTSVES